MEKVVNDKCSAGGKGPKIALGEPPPDVSAMEGKCRRVLAITTVCVLLLFVVFQPSLPSSLSILSRFQVPCPPQGAGAFSPVWLKSTALASFPGSGNTWVRHLLTTASGVLTGAIYDTNRDIPVTRERARRVLVVKTHAQPEKSRRRFPVDRAMLIVRNPYEALLAEFNREGKFSTKDEPDSFKIGVRRLEDFKTKWQPYVQSHMGKWANLYLAWAEDPAPTYVIVYHRLVTNLEQELRHMFNFLNLSSITPTIHCALLEPEGRAHRKKPEWQKEAAVFTVAQRKLLNADIERVQKALEAKTGQNFEDFQQWKR